VTLGLLLWLGERTGSLRAKWVFKPARSALFLLAATLFFVSDLTVAWAPLIPSMGFANQAVGLPLYYVAQFLLAHSLAGC